VLNRAGQIIKDHRALVKRRGNSKRLEAEQMMRPHMNKVLRYLGTDMHALTRVNVASSPILAFLTLCWPALS
jgi:hypothetical protein